MLWGFFAWGKQALHILFVLKAHDHTKLGKITSQLKGVRECTIKAAKNRRLHTFLPYLLDIFLVIPMFQDWIYSL